MYCKANIQTICDLCAASHWLIHYTTRLAYACVRLAYGQSEHSHTTNIGPIKAQYTLLSGINTRKKHNLPEISASIPRRNGSFNITPEYTFRLSILHKGLSMPVTCKFPRTPEEETPPTNPEVRSKYPRYVFA